MGFRLSGRLAKTLLATGVPPAQKLRGATLTRRGGRAALRKDADDNDDNKGEAEDEDEEDDDDE